MPTPKKDSWKKLGMDLIEASVPVPKRRYILQGADATILIHRARALASKARKNKRSK